MRFRMLVIVSAVLLLSFNTASGADVPNIDGSWKGKYNSGQGGMRDMDYAFKAYGSFLTGTTIGGATGFSTPGGGKSYPARQLSLPRGIRINT